MYRLAHEIKPIIVLPMPRCATQETTRTCIELMQGFCLILRTFFVSMSSGLFFVYLRHQLYIIFLNDFSDKMMPHVSIFCACMMDLILNKVDSTQAVAEYSKCILPKSKIIKTLLPDNFFHCFGSCHVLDFVVESINILQDRTPTYKTSCHNEHSRS